jgi:hypothetical protein
VAAIEVAEKSGETFRREGRIDEDREFWLVCFLRSRGCHIRLQRSFRGLEWHMEIESLEKQFPESDFYHLDFGGR